MAPRGLDFGDIWQTVIGSFVGGGLGGFDVGYTEVKSTDRKVESKG